jgi:antitoxin component of MazEF toxin-antitoxin module
MRNWGNSLGVVIPSEEVSKKGLKGNDELETTIRKAMDISELFGEYKFRDLQSLKDELRKGWR